MYHFFWFIVIIFISGLLLHLCLKPRSAVSVCCCLSTGSRLEPGWHRLRTVMAAAIQSRRRQCTSRACQLVKGKTTTNNVRHIITPKRFDWAAVQMTRRPTSLDTAETSPVDDDAVEWLILHVCLVCMNVMKYNVNKGLKKKEGGVAHTTCMFSVNECNEI